MKTRYQELFDKADGLLITVNGMGPEQNDQVRMDAIARAQVYATLALAEATRANRTVTMREDRP